MSKIRVCRQLLFGSIAVLLGAALAVALVELLLRASGRRPWRYYGAEINAPTIHEPDAELGWKAKPGSYEIPPHAPGSPAIRVTILPDGTRFTGAEDANGDGRSKLAFVGGSLTHGWAISDDETFAWRIQEQFPSLRVANFGTGGYGTYQSLLVLERVFSQPRPPRMVFYGFMEAHEVRNVAHPLWLLLAALRSRRGGVFIPYCTLDADGSLTRHVPVSYPEWPLRQHLATVAFLQEGYVNFIAGNRTSQGRAVTERLLIEMNRLVNQHGARLWVVLLHLSPTGKSHYVEFLERHGIDWIDCAFPMSREMKVPGEGHPNGKMHARWAECIAAKIRAVGEAGR